MSGAEKQKRSSSVRKSEKVETINSNPAGPVSGQKVEETKEKRDESKKAARDGSKVKRSTSETSHKGKSRERRHKHKNQVLVEEFFIPGGASHGHLQGGQFQLPPGPPGGAPQFQRLANEQQQYQQFEQQFVGGGAPQYQQYAQEQYIPGSPLAGGPQYQSFGEVLQGPPTGYHQNYIIDPVVQVSSGRGDLNFGGYAQAPPAYNFPINPNTLPPCYPVPQQQIFTGPSMVEQQMVLTGPPMPIPQPPQQQFFTSGYEESYDESILLPYDQPQQTNYIDTGYTQGLPPGSKIVAEYVLGFLDDFERQE